MGAAHGSALLCDDDRARLDEQAVSLDARELLRLLARDDQRSLSDGVALYQGERYESASGDMFALEEEIARVLVVTLAGKVEAAELARIARRPTDNLEAYDCG